MAAETTKRRNLGRGLSALLGEDEALENEAAGGRGPRQVPVELLRPGRFQPRHHMDDERLRELAQSISDKGVLQPLLVRPDAENPDSFEIIAGERRWRAAQLAQVHQVPVIVREMEDREALEIALIENLQREDLSALDEADGYRRLKDEFSYTQAALASALGKSRSHVANTMRLLNLPDSVKEMVERGTLSAGHARALLNAEDAVVLARAVARRGLNVRQTEKLVQAESRPAKPRRTAPGKDTDTIALERDLSNLLGLKVGIQFQGGAGTLTIHYQSIEQLDDILHRLSQGARGAPRAPGEPGSDEALGRAEEDMPDLPAGNVADADADSFDEQPDIGDLESVGEDLLENPLPPEEPVSEEPVPETPVLDDEPVEKPDETA